MGSMDSYRLAALRSSSAELLATREAALALHRDLLAEPPSPQILTKVSMGTSASSFHLVDLSTVSWWPAMYVRAFFQDDLERSIAILGEFIQATNQVPELNLASAGARDTLLSRLGLSPRQRLAEEAALSLEQLLAQPRLSSLHAEADHLCRLASQVFARQQQGVSLHSGDLKFDKAAREALFSALNLDAGEFDTLDRAHVLPAVQLRRSILDDPLSAPNLAARAQAVRKRMAQQRSQLLLAQLPVEKLKEVTNDRLRFAGLEDIGVMTVADVLNTSQSVLESVNGIGPLTASRMKAAAQSLATESLAEAGSAIGSEPSEPAVELVRILNMFEQSDVLTSEQADRRDRILEYFESFPENLSPWGPPFTVLKSGERYYEQFIEDMAWAAAVPESFRPGPATDPGPAAWQDYLARPAHYQSLLQALLEEDTEHNVDLPADTLEAIRSLRLDDSLLSNLYLRGYQSFGARFALVQKKIILGDEMGLGKTIQALAVAAHLAAKDKGARILAVVPASVLVNWYREATQLTTLRVRIAHGPEKETEAAQWAEEGGLLVVTYDGARTMKLATPTLLIVDEAHMVKNPAAQRSQAVAQLIAAADYAMLLTGTPLENRVSDFAQLVEYVAPGLTDPTEPISARAFKKKVAGVYLRRNQVDVLDELPEKVDHLEWVELGEADSRAYAEAIDASNWMLMRRASFLAPASQCAKMQRIREIVEEATLERRCVVIFSFFREVLARLEEEFAPQVVGVISGDVPPAKRQDYIDCLGGERNVLLAQIGAGGAGLNIQKASVVILTEVQVKPSVEDQAIARAHRMGQTRMVNVHRILGEGTVDEHLLELTGQKRALFDAYARDSTAATVADATDISETQLAEQIIAAERARLGFED